MAIQLTPSSLSSAMVAAMSSLAHADGPRGVDTVMPLIFSPEQLKKSDNIPVQAAAAAAHQRHSRSGREAAGEKKSKPMPAVAETPPQAAVSNGAAAPILAVARGRVFWRLTATTRQLELPQAANLQAASAPAGRTGRGSSGRLARRARAWWRRRPPQTQNTTVATKHEAPKANESLG